jgi:adenylylsulfate kinase
VTCLREGFGVWLTGLPASGKTTIARALEKALRKKGLSVEVLDGDEVRKNLSPDLGFTKEDREIHAKRVAYVTKLLVRNGVVVIVGLISPFRDFREHARKQIGNFVEVWVKCPLEECMRRDPKGLYKKAMNGEINDLTGIQEPYEEPLNPEVTVDTS